MSHKWIWKMEYCKKNGIPPAEIWAWEMAENAYNNQLLLNQNSLSIQTDRLLHLDITSRNSKPYVRFEEF